MTRRRKAATPPAASCARRARARMERRASGKLRPRHVAVQAPIEQVSGLRWSPGRARQGGWGVTCAAACASALTYLVGRACYLDRWLPGNCSVDVLKGSIKAPSACSPTIRDSFNSSAPAARTEPASCGSIKGSIRPTLRPRIWSRGPAWT